MDPNKIRFTEIKEGITIPVPRELSPEEEAAILAQAKAQFDPVASEAEWKELLRQREQGLLVSGEEVLAMLDELEALELKKRKESA